MPERGLPFCRHSGQLQLSALSVVLFTLKAIYASSSLQRETSPSLSTPFSQ